MFPLSLPLTPIPAPRPRVTSRGFTYYPKRYNEFRRKAEEVIPDNLLSEWPFPLREEIHIEVVFNIPKPKTTKRFYPRGDVDNYLKTLDVLNGHVWVDDDQITFIKAIKQWALEDPSIDLKIYTKEDDFFGGRK